MWIVPDLTSFTGVDGPRPLPAAAPPDWQGREDRVAWVREHLTPGEQALLYRLAHDVDGLRRDNVEPVIRKERKACGS